MTPRRFTSFYPPTSFGPIERDIEGPTLPLFPLPIGGPVSLPVHHTPCPTTGYDFRVC